MWLIEGIGKINNGWLTDTTGSKVYWGAPAGAESADSWASASQAAVETVASASQAAGEAVAGAVEQFAPPLLSEPLAIFTWINETFVAQAPYFFQIMIVLAELGIGLLFLVGLFTFPAAIVSLGLSIMFLIGALAGKEILWYMAVSIFMLGGAGKAFGLDYWVMPYIKKLWNKTPLAKKTYFYLDEPEFTKKQMERKLGRK
jgi:NADH dehydrogenase